MVFSVSPSVTVGEVDLTTTIPAITTPPAAIAGVFRWGPVNERVLISSEAELASVFGTPTTFNAETFFTAADFLAYSSALYVTRVVSASAAKATENIATPYFKAKYFGDIANAIDVAYVSVAPTPPGQEPSQNTNFDAELFDSAVFNTAGTQYAGIVKSTIEFGKNKMTLEIPNELNPVGGAKGLQVGDVLRIGNSEAGYQELVVQTLVITSSDLPSAIDPLILLEIFKYEITFDRRYTITETIGANLDFYRRWKYSSIFDAAPAEGDFHITVIDRLGNITGQAGTVLERFSDLSTSPNAKFADGSSKYYVEVLSTGSMWIEATEVPLTDIVARAYNSLSGGTDGDNENTIALGPIARGYDLYAEGNDIDISFVIQGKANSTDLANYIISNIAEYRKDCIAFLSPRKVDVVNIASPQAQLTNILNYRNAIQNSSYWVMDSGYKYRYDKYNDTFHWVPLNGDMAGLASLVQPWESPAGYRKGRVRNVIKLAFNPNKAQRDQLYGKDVNPVITQTGQGTILFGDKTGLGSSTGSAFTRINVRRLFIAVEKSIATISAQLLFEFNDEFTQNQFRQIVDPFLRDIQGRRGIIDFRVVSDSTVNTPQVIDSSTFRANIFIKPARSINFVELTFIATRTGVEFSELVGQEF